MAHKKHSYSNERITVSFDGGKCAHAGYCFRELHSVFDGDRDPPIDLNGGTVDEIVEVVEKCPSSALTYLRHDDGGQEVAADCASARIIPGGPLAIRGDLRMGDDKFCRLTLCRCGQSDNKPFCDGSHKDHDFDDGIHAEVEAISNGAEPAPVSFKAISNGPLFHDGAITYCDIEGEVICRKSKAAICRCGASKNKPFCDGSHKEISFKD